MRNSPDLGNDGVSTVPACPAASIKIITGTPNHRLGWAHHHHREETELIIAGEIRKYPQPHHGNQRVEIKKQTHSLTGANGQENCC